MRKNFKILLSSILTSLFIIPFASAALMPPIISDTLRRVFNAGVPEAYVLRMLITLLVFLVFYWGAGALFQKGGGFGDKKTNMFRWTISLVMALIVGLFTPFSLLETYKTIMLLSIPLLGTAGILLLAHKAAKHKHHISAALLYLFLMTIVSLVIAKSNEFGIREHRLITGFSFIDMFELILFVAFILMLVHFGKSLGLKKGSLFGRHEPRIPHTPDNHDPHDPHIPGEKSPAETAHEQHRPMAPEEKQEQAREDAVKKHDEKIEGAEEGEEKKEEKAERKAIKRGIRLFKELKVLKELVMEWIEVAGADYHKDMKRTSPYRKKINDELKRIRENEGYIRTLERYTVKEVKKVEYLEQLGGRMKDQHEQRVNQLVLEDAHLGEFFKQILDFIEAKLKELDYDPKIKALSQAQMLEPKKQILSAINKALQVSVHRIEIEKEEVKETEAAEVETKRAEKTTKKS